MAKKRKLGKGLNALLSGSNFNESSLQHTEPVTLQAITDKPETTPEDQTLKNNQLAHLPVEWIQRGKYQPRQDMHQEALNELASSIKEQGVMQPIVVRPIGEQRYEIIAGERRWRATQLAQIDTIPAVIKDVPDEAAVAMALIENIQREDLNPIEEAMALQRLRDEFDLTHQAVANAVGKSRTTVTNLLRLMSMNEDVRRMLEHGDIEMGHARAVLSLDHEQQKQTAQSIVAKGLSVRQAEGLVRRLLLENNSEGTKPVFKVDPDIRRLQDELADKVGAPTMIQHTVKGKGKLVFKYDSLDELEGILAHIH